MNTEILNIPDFIKVGVMAWLFLFLVKFVASKINGEKGTD